MPFDFLHTGSQLLQAVMHNIRLLCPSGCPDDLWQILLKCWETRADKRPTFATLVHEIGLQMCLSESVITVQSVSGGNREVQYYLRILTYFLSSRRFDSFFFYSFCLWKILILLLWIFHFSAWWKRKILGIWVPIFQDGRVWESLWPKCNFHYRRLSHMERRWSQEREWSFDLKFRY